MSNVITLDSIRAAADRKFASKVIDLGDTQVELLSPVRLGKKVRDRLSNMSDEIKGGADQEVVLAEVLASVAKTEEQGAKLLEAIGDDLAVLIAVFEAYGSEVELGEASDSES